MDCTQIRCLERIDLFLSIVNSELSRWNCLKLPLFNICLEYRDFLISEILKEICLWNGGKYKNEPTTFDDWYCKIRVWWNRDKANKFGDKLFAPLMILIMEFLQNQCKHLNQVTKLALFLDIFISILESKIKFKQSMARPLIPFSIFIKKNKFKTICDEFINYFGIKTIEWNDAAKQCKGHDYISNKHRSSELFTKYLNCCKIIKNNFIKMTNNIKVEINFGNIWKIQSKNILNAETSVTRYKYNKYNKYNQYNQYNENNLKVVGKYYNKSNQNQSDSISPNTINHYNAIIFALAQQFMENDNNINNINNVNNNNNNGYCCFHSTSQSVSALRYKPSNTNNYIINLLNKNYKM